MLPYPLDLLRLIWLFKLRGLDPTARYIVRDLDSLQSTEFSGKVLMETGVPISLRNQPASALLMYRLNLMRSPRIFAAAAGMQDFCRHSESRPEHQTTHKNVKLGKKPKEITRHGKQPWSSLYGPRGRGDSQH